MRTISLTGTSGVGLVERPEPVAKDDIVKVQLRVVPMCTEFKAYAAGPPSDHLGHEAAGVVVDPGSSHRVGEGDRVVVMPQYGCGVCILCTSGEHIYCPHQRDVLSETGSSFGTATFAEYLIKPDWLLLPVPVDISLRHAAMACCALGPSFNAMNAMRVSALDTVLVIGCGPVGLGAVVNAVARGARVVAVDINHYRLTLAKKLGAIAGVDASSPTASQEILGLCPSDGADAMFDSTGLPESVRLMEKVARARARLSFVAMNQPLELHRVVQRGLEVHGCWHWNHQRYASDMFEVILRSNDALNALVTHEFALDNVEEAFQVQLSGACGKVLLYPFGAEVSI